MVDLSGSRWAPAPRRTENFQPSYQNQLYQSSSTPASGAATPNSIKPVRLSKSQKDLLSRRSDALKLAKLSRRLKWKSRTLLFCYHRALSERQQNVVGGIGFLMEEGEAEMMFKIDFFEFYVLLERVLVHLLGVFGMVVSAAYGGGTKTDGDGLRKEKDPGLNVAGPKSLREELLERHQQNALIGDSMIFHGYAHRFHANVLAALDIPSNPLHEVLGTGVVRDYLGIAKEFRNRWKDAEEKPADLLEDGLIGSRYEKMLNDLKLEEMLGMILVAIETARPMAEQELTRFESTVGGGAELTEAMMELDETSSDAPWEAMPDAMDWD